MSIVRSVYIISDLHLGGAYPDPTTAVAERQRGFRMMTRAKELAGFIEHIASLNDSRRIELVIAGDFVDFLAEDAAPQDQPPVWKPFRGGREEARDVFKTIADRDDCVFVALQKFLATGKALTILLGNHDIELTIPDVRAALMERLGPGNFRLIDDGQALELGDVLVDHGNLFDPANVVDHDQLRLVRALYSRGWYEDVERAFRPPAGSRLVAEVMNPLKVDYAFIDLLKPESEPLFALLLSIEPGCKRKLGELAVILAAAARTYVPNRNAPWALRNVASVATTKAEIDESAALEALIARLVDDQSLQLTMLGVAAADAANATNVAAGEWRGRWSLFRLLIGGDQGDLASRIPQVQATLRVLQNDTTFVRDKEEARYQDAAEWLAEAGPRTRGYQAIIFGHTHRAKSLVLPQSGAQYLNCGTWANTMRFPEILTSRTASKDEIAAALTGFAKKLTANELEVEFAPTYARIDLGADDTFITAELCEYDWKADRLG